MFIIEYYEAASQEWYQYGDEVFANKNDAERAIRLYQFKDHYSAKLNLRATFKHSIHKHNGFCGSLSD